MNAMNLRACLSIGLSARRMYFVHTSLFYQLREPIVRVQLPGAAGRSKKTNGLIPFLKM